MSRRLAKLAREAALIVQQLQTRHTWRVAGNVDVTYTRGGVLLWDSPSKGFSIDSSDIRGWRPGDDITVENSLTGGVALFSGRPYHEERDREGELMYWRLRGPKGTSLTIFND